MASNFATRYKKDLSIDTLKTKLVRRKSVLQKESRLREFNKGRQFGLVDVNTQPLRDKAFSQQEERSKECLSTSKANQNASAKTREQERMEMLQRYKAEKELRKLKDQREKPIFKCGHFKPEDPSFLSKPSQIPILSKPKEKETPAVVRVTRSKSKNQLPEPSRPQLSAIVPSRGCRLPTAQHKQKQIYIDKPAKKDIELKTSNGRMLRAAVAAKSKIPQVSQSSAIAGNLPQKRVTVKGKQEKEKKKKDTMQIVQNMNEDILVEQEKEEMKPQPAAGNKQNEAFLEKENISASYSLIPAPTKRNRSFAPQNFVFQAPEGLITYKVKPMSPSRANMFLSPNLSWSPSETTNEVCKEGAKETMLQDYELQLSFNPGVTKEDLEGNQHEPDLLNEAKGDFCKFFFPDLSSNEMREDVFERKSSEEQPDLPVKSEPTVKPQHDVPYFRNILQSETERLASHCLEWDETVEMDIPEEAKDLVRTTIGQTRLLMAERFKQFERLVDNCEFRRGEKETTCADLDGFWDMVNFQVEDVNKKFENLKKLQVNGWQMVDEAQSKRPAKKKPVLRRAIKAAGGSAERRAARKRLAAVKAALKTKKKEGSAAAASGKETPKEAELIFDGGFFQIESPAKPFPDWTPKSASRTSQRISRHTTPKSAHKALLQSCAETCVIRQGTPRASKAIPPVQDLNMCSDPAGMALLAATSEQSDIQATEELYAIAEDAAEIATDAQTASCDRASSSNRDKQDVLSPREDSQSARTHEPDEELHAPESPRLGFPHDDGMLDFQPNLDASLYFTPRNQPEKCRSADSCKDLIVFSPFPLLD